jgi:plastocyanin
MSMRLAGGLVAGIATLAVATTVAVAQRAGGGAAPVAAGTVVGKITFDGKAPRPRVIRMGSDPLCMTESKAGTMSEVLLVGPGNGLQNAFVYVKDGLGTKTFPAPKTPVVLDQSGCKYLPHVVGIQVGQPLEVRNSDSTLHNVHAVPKVNKEFNFGQPTKGMKASKAFDKPEVMVPFRCDVHGWMNAYAGVLPHPFFAVSKNDGAFEIKGLPPGSYTIEVWHEQLGTQTLKVTVDAKAGATANFAMKGKA